MDATLAKTINPRIVETVVKGIMENMPEASQSMDCLEYKYDAWRYRFKDYEDGKVYILDKEKLLATFPLIFSDKWPAGVVPAPTIPDTLSLSEQLKLWDDWLCQSDADSFDAFVQLACFGEVVFG